MKRVMASALTLALILGAVGCVEKKDDNASIIGGADGPTSIYLAPSAGSDKISENHCYAARSTRRDNARI